MNSCSPHVISAFEHVHLEWFHCKLSDMFREKQVSLLLKSKQTSSFSNFALPIVRRVIPSLIANQIVSVQPMTTIGAGRVFYMDTKYTKYDSVVWKKLRKAGLKRKY
jgi:hypothetical protein